MRTCTKCSVSKAEDEFAKNGKYLRNTCLACRNQKNKESYYRHKERRLAEVKRYYQENREQKLEYAKKWARENKHRHRQYGRNGTLRLRRDVFTAYGGKCECCGIDEEMFLTIDHIDGNGNQHRKEVLGSHLMAGTHFYRWLRQNGYPEGFRVLCFNCNMGRHRNGGICPHKARLVVSDDE